MANHIIFLGTAGDSLVAGKQMRASGGIILVLEDNQFMLDPGPGALVMAKECNINIRDTVCVLVSHGHTNHANDLNAVLEAMSVSGLDRVGVLVTNKKVINGDEKEIPSLKKRSHDFVERVLELEPGKRVGINNINIYMTKAEHYDSEATGFIFETPTYKVGYSSDTEYSEEIADQYKGCHVMIVNCKNTNETRTKGHLCPEDVAKFLKRVKPSLALLSHFGIKMIQDGPLSIARDIQRESGVEVIAATDGMSINPASFASKMRKLTEF